MNILNIEHISKVFGDKIIFDDASFGLAQGDKAGIVGINGTGKTTLLRMVAGIETPASGQVVMQNGIRLAYLPQNPDFPKGATVASYALSGNSETDWMVQSHLSRLHVDDYDALLENMSGGQRRKVAMAKTFAGDFDFLLLDEPTNHLDGAMVSWLEAYLKSFKGTLLMVTHDRYFLDAVTNKIIELDHGKIYDYDANYSKFLELKAQRAEMALASERKRQSVLRMEIEWAKRGCQARSTKQKARLLRLEQLKQTAAPVKDETVSLDGAGAARMGKKTIEFHHVSKSFGEKRVIDDFDYIVLKNQRLGIIGPNGCGKSTLMKLAAGLETPDEGSVDIGETIKIGYFAQEEQHMDERVRVIDYVKDIAEYILTKDGRISASQMLERFLFTPDMQYAPIGKLSGGEKRRLYLLGVLAAPMNTLILDEPGNSLDIPTLTILEDYLNAFPGIVITVSHDRYFLDNVVDRIFEFDTDGHLTQYEGGYTDYIEAKQRRSDSGKAAPGTFSDKKKSEERSAGYKEWKERRQPKLKFTYKEQKEYETIDEDIEKLEARISDIDGAMLENATNSAKLSQLMKEKEEAEDALSEKMERWVYLNELAEKIEAEKGN